MLLDSHLASDTRALVIDFDHGEIKDQSDDQHKERQAVVCPCICLCWAWLTTH